MSPRPHWPLLRVIHASSNVILLDQPAFASGGATPFDFGAKPLFVVYRGGQQVERNLVD
jgi:hypothetical protein